MKCHTKIQLIYSIIYLALIRDNSLLKISYLSKEFNHIGVTELFAINPKIYRLTDSTVGEPILKKGR